MVRGLIQQQQVRLRDERSTKHHAPPPSAGQIRHAGIARELETRDDLIDFELPPPLLVRAVRGAGGEVYVWTVDELPRLRALEALGVSGLITNDPRLFAAAATA